MKGVIILTNCFLSRLLEKRPALAEKYSSEQYQLSKDILFWKHYNEKSVEEMAELLQMTLKTYLEFESGYTKYSVEEYRELLYNLKIIDHLNTFSKTTKYDAVSDSARLSNSKINQRIYNSTRSSEGTHEVYNNASITNFSKSHSDYEDVESFDVNKKYLSADSTNANFSEVEKRGDCFVYR